jgi:hypothetical protein
MPRIRSIKPEFPQSESMGRVSRDARLCFVELWTIADDSGRLRGNSRMLASLLFPYDEDAPDLIDGWLSELEGEGCITRYAVGTSNYLQINNWLSHQKIDKPTASKIPTLARIREDSRGFDEDSTRIREDSSEDLRSKEGKGEEGKGGGAGAEGDAAALLPGIPPAQESQELADFAYRLAVKRKAKIPEAMAQKLMTEPDVIAAFELERSAKRGKPKKTGPAFPNPPLCDCPEHGEIVTVHPGDRGRCRACKAIWEFNDDPEILIWIKSEDGIVSETG